MNDNFISDAINKATLELYWLYTNDLIIFDGVEMTADRKLVPVNPRLANIAEISAAYPPRESAAQ